ncbi:suppressor protein SRP40 [Punica granatum]|nr:suppressor protein SRP40 [Punica granatum]OWM86946.1 hypothetical protein CDL15_Pgr015982 [Punica granatum]
MPKTLPSISSSINPSLIALTPRQVLLAKPTMTATKPSSLSEEDRMLLHLSIAQYFQKNGFPKTLKKFRSEAQLEEDGWKGSKLDLEETCLKFLDKGKITFTHSDGLDQDGKKAKQSGEDSKNLVADQSGAAVEQNTKEKETKKSSDALTKGSIRERRQPGTDDSTSELQQADVEKKRKDKKKKDRKSVPESVSQEETQQTETVPEATAGKSEDLTTSKGKSEASSEVEKKSKDKKKKKSKSTSDGVADDVDENQDARKSKSATMDSKKAGSEGETISSEVNKDNKPQKRKRSESDENDSQLKDKEDLEQSKRRKKETKKESKASEEKSDVKASPNKEVDLLKSQKTPSKHLDSKENGNLDKTAEKSTTAKNTNKQCNGSAEAKSTTVKAFQRVKVDEVEFADNRLKDNSYWAKDGAEVGYGAKAQEVLGQVRGRDFRHEKTKKKRGSYRGGQIDLQSHSVKFNYDDE